MRSSSPPLALVPIEKGLYLLDFPYDDQLDALLRGGVKNAWGLARFVQKRFSGAIPFARSGGFACTTFRAESPDGHPLLARNFDYRDGPAAVIRCAPPGGYRSIGVAPLNVMLYGNKWQQPERSDPRRLLLAPYACMDGVNEKGLAIAVLELKARSTRQRTGKKPIITTVFIRAVLDRCATTGEAIRMFERFDMRASLFCDYHFHLLDAAGRSAVIEYIGGKMHVLEGQPYAMNFYLLPGGDNRKAMGYDREKTVSAALRETNSRMSREAALAVLEKCRLDYRHRLGYRVMCLWSAVYDCRDASMLLRGGAERRDNIEINQMEV